MAECVMEPRQELTPEYFKNRYWLKMELITLCKTLGLTTPGAKQELLTRIETFIVTGIKTSPVSNTINAVRDSNSPITRNTPVMNYKNDAATRQFFIEQIGKHFRFNAYLRQFTQRNNNEKLTYGDLVDGWVACEQKKKNPDYQSDIGKQFEYNQFTRDFFLNEKGKSQSDAIQAWKRVKSLSGPKTYEHYRYLCQREKS